MPQPIPSADENRTSVGGAGSGIPKRARKYSLEEEMFSKYMSETGAGTRPETGPGMRPRAVTLLSIELSIFLLLRKNFINVNPMSYALNYLTPMYTTLYLPFWRLSK